MSYLDGKDARITRHDLAKEPPSRAFLEKHVDASNLDHVLNRRSPSFKERGLGERTLTKKEAIDLMLEDTNLIRRPIVVAGGKATFGYAEQEWDELLD